MISLPPDITLHKERHGSNPVNTFASVSSVNYIAKTLET